jgi:uncharacterized protein (TIGR02145 family)/uncharacterized repeat protein (TIGR02543 family)
MTLVEVLVGSAIFVILALSVYQGYKLAMDVIRVSRIKVTATALANEQFEIMRNLPYADVGIAGGLPPGKIPYTQTLIRDGKEFVVITTIRNIDDPFDGELGGMVNDTSPADYKLAELEITCALCRNFPPINVTTYIGPKNLESASTNGALFIKVFDANGVPLPGASVHVENNSVVPSFVIDDVTNNDGLLQIVDAPPGVQVYEITVSKDGYTTERTYPVGEPANPNPVKTHATVSLQQLTQISFFIDKASTLQISSVSDTCLVVPNFDFSLHGEKLIGVDIYKFDDLFTTDSAGEESITGLDWDTYKLTTTDDTYDLAGVIPANTFTLSPDTIQTVKLILSPKSPQSLLITVKDVSTGLPLSEVAVNLTGAEYDTTYITGRGFLRQTDWAGGAGQDHFSDPAKYFDSDGNADISSFGGTIKLKSTLGEYATSTWLISSTFDTGSASNFHKISWQPEDQPAETGLDSIRLQVATNSGGEVWNFKGPDGTADTFYTVTSQEINSNHDGDRYLRYKIFLQTADLTKTPTVSDVSFTFTSDCVPPGQVFFTGLLSGNYNLSLAKADYQPVSETININSSWQQREIAFTPSEYTPVSVYTVTYSGNSNTRGFVPVDHNAYEVGDIVTVLDNTEDLARTGYYFSGWNTSLDGTGTSRATSSAFIIGASNVTLYAEWVALGPAVSFNANGGTGVMTPQIIVTGEEASLTANSFTRDGYFFAGWATSTIGSIAYPDTGTYSMGVSSSTLYAVWLENCSGTTLDTRDGKSYAINLIGLQCWMAENINVGTIISATSNQNNTCTTIRKYCYSNTESNCTSDGGLYQWTQAMCGITTPGTQGLCPAGWHIPTHEEFTTLERTVCTSGTCTTDFPYDTTTTGDRGTNEGTTLKSGVGLFKALLSGYRYPSTNTSRFNFLDSAAYIWSSTPNGNNRAWSRILESGLPTIERNSTHDKDYGFSVRCVRN